MVWVCMQMSEECTTTDVSAAAVPSVSTPSECQRRAFHTFEYYSSLRIYIIFAQVSEERKRLYIENMQLN